MSDLLLDLVNVEPEAAAWLAGTLREWAAQAPAEIAEHLEPIAGAFAGSLDVESLPLKNATPAALEWIVRALGAAAGIAFELGYPVCSRACVTISAVASRELAGSVQRRATAN